MPENHPTRHAHNFKDLTGQRFGRLLVVEYAGTTGNAFRTLWRCRCDCGATPVVLANSLATRRTRSCGCLQPEIVTARNFRHGLAKKGQWCVEYRPWAAMIQRCYNPDCKGFKYYGGRGITVCPEWRNSFAAFIRDMGSRPSGSSLDRINNDGNYSCGRCPVCRKNGWPPNCRWADRTTQSRNSRHAHKLTAHRKTMCLSAWSEETGIPYSTIKWRLRMGWSAERIVSEPHQK